MSQEKIQAKYRKKVKKEFSRLLFLLGRLESHPPLSVAMTMTWSAHNLKQIRQKKISKENQGTGVCLPEFIKRWVVNPRLYSNHCRSHKRNARPSRGMALPRILQDGILGALGFLVVSSCAQSFLAMSSP